MWEEMFGKKNFKIGSRLRIRLPKDYEAMAKRQIEEAERIVNLPKEIKDVVGYEWNNSIYPSRLAAMKAKAEAELKILFPRETYSMLSCYPGHSQIVEEYKKVIAILSEIKE